VDQKRAEAATAAAAEEEAHLTPFERNALALQAVNKARLDELMGPLKVRVTAAWLCAAAVPDNSSPAAGGANPTRGSPGSRQVQGGRLRSRLQPDRLVHSQGAGAEGEVAAAAAAG
jgi:hypothetical protein